MWYENCQQCDILTELENVKNWKISKKQKKIWSLVVSKPESNNFRLKTLIETKF